MVSMKPTMMASASLNPGVRSPSIENTIPSPLLWCRERVAAPDERHERRVSIW
jgi:hypothetical protein